MGKIEIRIAKKDLAANMRNFVGGPPRSPFLALFIACVVLVSGLEAGLAAELKGTGLLRPDRIRIYNASANLSESDIKEIEFQLACRFSAEIEMIDSPILRLRPGNPIARRSYSEKRRQYSADRVLEGLSRVLKVSDSKITFQFVIVDVDLFDEPYNFLFGMSHLSWLTGVYSTHRLSLVYSEIDGSYVGQSSELLIERLVKLLSKNTAKMAGLVKSEQCIMRWPGSLGDLDMIPNDFCEPDVAALKVAGILRSCDAPMVLDGLPDVLVDNASRAEIGGQPHTLLAFEGSHFGSR